MGTALAREVLLWANQGHWALSSSCGKAAPGTGRASVDSGRTWPSLPLPPVGPTPWAVGEGMAPTAPTPSEAQATGPQSRQDREGPVEAGLWLMNEGRSGGAVALEGSLLEGSKPRGEEGTAPAPGVPPILTSGGSGGGWHPWPSVLRPEAGQGVRMSDFPWSLSRCPVSLAREAGRAWSLFLPAFHSLRSSSPGCRCRDWLLAVPPLQPTFPHGKQEAGLACPHRIE